MKNTSMLFGAAFAAFALSIPTVQAESKAADVLKAHFGESLQTAEGKKVDLKSLEGKAVGIYFSAHWCGPCRAFTPELVKFRDANSEKFEVVFVSSDRSEEERKGYIKDAGMKWLGLPLNGDESKALKKKYEVSGIPALVILRSDGELLSRDGRSLIMSKPDPALINDPKAKVDVATEDYKCSNCDKTHQRKVAKLVKG
jgi:nucleoredoxin